jgi:hypothetical protein
LYEQIASKLRKLADAHAATGDLLKLIAVASAGEKTV